MEGRMKNKQARGRKVTGLLSLLRQALHRDTSAAQGQVLCSVFNRTKSPRKRTKPTSGGAKLGTL